MFMKKIGWRAIFQMAETVVFGVGSKISTEEKLFNDLTIEIRFNRHLENCKPINLNSSGIGKSTFAKGERSAEKSAKDEVVIHDETGKLVFQATRNHCRTFVRDSFWINHLRDLAEMFKDLGP